MTTRNQWLTAPAAFAESGSRWHMAACSSYASHCPCDFGTPPWVFRYPETAPAMRPRDGDRSGAASLSPRVVSSADSASPSSFFDQWLSRGARREARRGATSKFAEKRSRCLIRVATSSPLQPPGSTGEVEWSTPGKNYPFCFSSSALVRA